MLFTIDRENGPEPDTYELYAYRDNGGAAQFLWKRDFGDSGGSLAFGPGSTVYAIPVTGYGQIIHALSEGAIGDPNGAAMNFLNNRAPAIPTNPTPANGARDLPNNVTVSWQDSDPDGHALKYDLFLADMSSTNAIFVLVAAGLSSSQVQLPVLQLGKTYLWRVVASDGQATTEGPAWALTTAGEPVGRFTSIRLIQGQVRIEWQGSGVLQTATNVLGSWSDLVTSTNILVTSPTGAKRFYRLKR